MRLISTSHRKLSIVTEQSGCLLEVAIPLNMHFLDLLLQEDDLAFIQLVLFLRFLELLRTYYLNYCAMYDVAALTPYRLQRLDLCVGE